MLWLMVGTSPSVTKTLPLIDVSEFDGVATCNGGIELVPIPKLYMLVDMDASAAYGEAARNAQRHGTHCVTLDRDKRALADRNVDWFDEFLLLGEVPTRRAFGPFRYTGPLLLEYILHSGATEIVMVGCDGYTTGTETDYFNHYTPLIQPAQRAAARTAMMAVAFTERAALFPEVQITQIGQPSYEIPLPHWGIQWSQ